MNRLYIIISGCYSDWDIMGYTTSREKAERICYSHNCVNKGDNWYVTLADELVSMGSTNDSEYWNYRIVIREKDNQYSFDNFCSEDLYVELDNKACIPKIEKRKYSHGYYYTITWSNTRFLSYEEAKKVANDMLMEELAARLL